MPVVSGPRDYNTVTHAGLLHGGHQPWGALPCRNLPSSGLFLTMSISCVDNSRDMTSIEILCYVGTYLLSLLFLVTKSRPAL